MGSLINYSGISTKVRAMERWKIRKEQFEQMAALETVPEAVRFLREFPPYREIFAGVEDTDLHRGKIEQLLNLAQYKDFARLYKFADVEQRNFLDLYFMHYEIGILKTCLRNVAGRQEMVQDLSDFKEFFEKHSCIDLIELSRCENIEQFIEGLHGSVYYGPLKELEKEGKATFPACESAMDMLYFRTMWKIKDKNLSGKESKIIKQCFGTRMDMLNLQWICRAKKYYRMSAADIYALIIPVSLHLKKTEIRQMAEAETLDQVYEVIRGCWYGRLDAVSIEEGESLEELAREIIDRIYELTSRKEPYSIATLNSYLHFKEREIEQIITTIEKIRYGVSASR